MPGDDDAGKRRLPFLKLELKLEATHARHANIQNHASQAVVIFVQKLVRTRVRAHAIAHGREQVLERLLAA